MVMMMSKANIVVLKKASKNDKMVLDINTVKCSICGDLCVCNKAMIDRLTGFKIICNGCIKSFGG